MGDSSLNTWFTIGCAIICTVCIQFELNFLLALVIFFSILLPFLNMLNLFLYRAIFVYPDRISISTCLCFDTFQLKTRTIEFRGHGLYINAEAREPFIHRILFPWIGYIYFRAVPGVDPVLQCELTVKTINNLLNQLHIFFEGIGQEVFIESGSSDIPLDEMQSSTALKSFCLRLAKTLDRGYSVTDDVNWLRLIAEVCDLPIAEKIQSHPLPLSPNWLAPGEHLVLCLNGFLKGFRKKGYLCFTNSRVVLTNLSGDYVDGTNYHDQTLRRHCDPGYWRIEFNMNITGQAMAGPLPIFSILTFFTNRARAHH